jgi:universal stress protein A
MKIKRILVPTDFSDHSLKSLDYAVDFARSQHGAELLIVHVVEPIRHTRLIPDVSEILEQQRTDAAERIAALERRVRRHYPRCRSEVHFGVPYQAIADVAEKSKADLIIIATHGHTGLAHLLLGSVAERVVRIAKCPVLAVHTLKPPAAARRSHRPRPTTRAAR